MLLRAEQIGDQYNKLLEMGNQRKEKLEESRKAYQLGREAATALAGPGPAAVAVADVRGQPGDREDASTGPATRREPRSPSPGRVRPAPHSSQR